MFKFVMHLFGIFSNKSDAILYASYFIYSKQTTVTEVTLGGAQ